jgi:hypothetical protein
MLFQFLFSRIIAGENWCSYRNQLSQRGVLTFIGLGSSDVRVASALIC